MADGNVLRDLGPIDIQKYQQNRFPCFFIDYIEEAVPGKSANGYKNFTYNEWFFPAHFPDEPNVPGFVQIEALVQVFLMSFLTIPGNEGRKAAALAHKAKFRRKIIPGHRLDIVAELDSYRRGIAIGRSTGYITGEFACQAEFTVGIPEVMDQFIPVRQ